jgi:hypothetical protein
MKITGKEAIIALLDGKAVKGYSYLYKIVDKTFYVGDGCGGWRATKYDMLHEIFYSVGHQYEIVEEKDNKQLLQEASNILADVVMNNPMNSCTTLVAKRLINILNKIEL